MEVFGKESESVHDAIDLASVRVGRQKDVGDGDPMTTWQEESSSAEIASYIWTSGQGDSARKLLVLVGSLSMTEPVMRALVGHRIAE